MKNFFIIISIFAYVSCADKESFQVIFPEKVFVEFNWCSYEENKDADHPKLWKNFALAMGSDSEKIEKVKKDWFTKEMIDNCNTYDKCNSLNSDNSGVMYSWDNNKCNVSFTQNGTNITSEEITTTTSQ